MSRCPDYEHVYGTDPYLVETLPEEREFAVDIPLTHKCRKSFAKQLVYCVGSSDRCILVFVVCGRSIGGIVNISWVQHGKVESGSFCWAQG